MAMLAAPRRRKRVVNLRSKNPWSEDNSKYGQKMLEKMGWANGKGLGKDLNGMTDHIKVRFKDDNGGLGFKDKNDQWTEHDDSFSTLLKSLNGGSVNDDKLHSETSLEEKSKSIKSRLHYKKFTRGKDISKYSSKDLANIFGKKSLKTAPKIEEVPAVEEENEEDTVSSNYTFVASGSINDYFKSKMSKKDIKVFQEITDQKEIEDDDGDFAFRGFKSNDPVETSENTESNKINFVQFNKSSLESDIVQFTRTDDGAVKKKKKKNKMTETGCDENNISEQLLANEEALVENKKKSKKHKIVVEDLGDRCEKMEEEIDSNVKRKSKKSKKSMDEEIEHVPNKIKKKKSKSVS